MKDSELLATIFAGDTHPLREACAAWMASSRLFRAFLEENAGKIRKKARQAGDAESLRDLWLEMETAYHLVAERRVTLAYEHYLAGKMRGPDYTVTFKGHLVFNVEVRRLRTPISRGKLAGVVCEKLRQMPRGVTNILLIGVDHSASGGLEVAATMKRLAQRAEAKQDDYFVERGLAGSREFLQALQRLSGVLLRTIRDDGATSNRSLWLNPQARHPLPAEAQKLLRG